MRYALRKLGWPLLAVTAAVGCQKAPEPPATSSTSSMTPQKPPAEVRTVPAPPK